METEARGKKEGFYLGSACVSGVGGALKLLAMVGENGSVLESPCKKL